MKPLGGGGGVLGVGAAEVLWAEQLLLFLLYVCSWRVAVGFMREAISHGDDSVEVRITRHYTEAFRGLGFAVQSLEFTNRVARPATLPCQLCTSFSKITF